MVLLLAAACVRRARDMVQAVAAASLLKVGHVHVLVPNICK